MRELNPVRDTFFSMHREPVKRPMSVATEFVDTDWEDDGFLTDFEEPLPNSSPFDNSPRASLHSVPTLPPGFLFVSVLANTMGFRLDVAV